MIKAIETSYKNYRFRSRLEARWAVYFDALKIDWEYETEGYELIDGRKYLPDFYLPKQKCFVEIKPLFDISEIDKYKSFSREKGQWIELIAGQPGKHDFFAYAYGREIGPIAMGMCENCKDYLFGVFHLSQQTLHVECYKCNLHSYYGWPDCSKESRAIEMARCARFEFGDSP